MKVKQLFESRVTPETRKYINHIYGNGFPHPFDSRQVLFTFEQGNEVVSVELVPLGDNIVELRTIMSSKRGAGYGSKVLSFLTTVADEMNIILKLEAVPFNKQSTVTQLKKFYKAAGFVPDDGSAGDFKYQFVRYPKS